MTDQRRALELSRGASSQLKATALAQHLILDSLRAEAFEANRLFF